jgi:hypothetical protein
VSCRRTCCLSIPEDLGTDICQEGFGKPAAQQHDAVAGVVHEEQGHSSAQMNTFCSNFVGIEAKLRFAAVVGGAGCAEAVPKEFPGQGKGGTMQVHCIDSDSAAVIGDKPEDTLNQRSCAFDRAQDGIGCTALCRLVHIFVIFLGHENNGGDVDHHGQARVAMRDHALALIAEDEAKEADYFGAAQFRRRGVLTRAHCKRNSQK